MDKAADASSGGNGLELIIRCVNDRTCFVALPRAVADARARTAYRVPLPLALAPRASLPRSNGRVPNSAEKAPPFAAWAGAVSGCDGAIEIPLALADCLGLKDGEPVRVAGRPSAPIAAFVELKPETGGTGTHRRRRERDRDERAETSRVRRGRPGVPVLAKNNH